MATDKVQDTATPNAKPSSTGELRPILVSTPGKYTKGKPLVVIHKRQEILFLVLFNNGMIGEYDANGQLRSSFDSRAMSNIEGGFFSGGIVAFDINGQKKYFSMDITYKNTTSTLATAGGGIIGIMALNKTIGSVENFFEQIKNGKLDIKNKEISLPLPKQITVPDYGGAIKKQGKIFYIIGGVTLGIALLLLLAGFFAWFLWFLGVVFLLGGYVRDIRAK